MNYRLCLPLTSFLLNDSTRNLSFRMESCDGLAIVLATHKFPTEWQPALRPVILKYK